MANTSEPATRQLIESSLLEIFSSLKEGKDVAPKTVFLTEGLMEAALVMKEITPGEAQDLLQRCWQEAMKESYPDWVDAPSLEDGVTIPIKMQRAPVYPSTSS